MGLVMDDHPLARDARAGVSYADVVKKVMPSVVKVEVTTAAKETSMDMPGMLNDPRLPPILRQSVRRRTATDLSRRPSTDSVPALS